MTFSDEHSFPVQGSTGEKLVLFFGLVECRIAKAP